MVTVGVGPQNVFILQLVSTFLARDNFSPGTVGTVVRVLETVLRCKLGSTFVTSELNIFSL